jgi:hypothetical protein
MKLFSKNSSTGEAELCQMRPKSIPNWTNLSFIMDHDILMHRRVSALNA